MDFEADLKKLIEDMKPRQNPYRVNGYSFGYRPLKKEVPFDKTVGPGEYKIDMGAIKPKIAPRFGKAGRFESLEISKEGIPGPGTYEILDINSSLIRSPNHSKDASSLMSPSKGNWPKGKRSDITGPTAVNILGPGAYYVPREFEKPVAKSLTKAFKTSGDEGNNTQYQSIASRSAKSLLYAGPPGPGNYTVTSPLTYGHKGQNGFSIGSSVRNFIDPNVVLNQGLNGSDYYKYSKPSTIGKDGPKISFGAGKRANINLTIAGPGPAAYQTEPSENKTTKNNSYKGSWGKAYRKIHDGVELGPGPGEYDISYKYSKKGVKLTRDSKSRGRYERSPGPGSYDILDEFDRKKREVERQLALHKLRTMASAMADSKAFGSTKSGGSPRSFGSGLNTSRRGRNRTASSDRDSVLSRSFSPSQSRSGWIDSAIKNSASPGPKYLVRKGSIEQVMVMGTTGTKFSTFARPLVDEEAKRRNLPGPGTYESDAKIHTGVTEGVSFAVGKRKENPLVPPHTYGIPGPDQYEQLISKYVVGGLFPIAGRDMAKDPSIQAPKVKRKQKARYMQAYEDMMKKKEKVVTPPIPTEEED